MFTKRNRKENTDKNRKRENGGPERMRKRRRGEN